MIVCTFYTKDTPYEWDVWSSLRRSLDRIGVKWDATAIEAHTTEDSTTYWHWASRHVPLIVRAAMDRNPGEPVLYLDADSTIECALASLYNLDRQGVDLLVHRVGGDDAGAREYLDDRFICFANNLRTRQFLDLWTAHNAFEANKRSRRTMPYGAFEWAARCGLRVSTFPAECRFSDHAKPHQSSASEAVIVHHRASDRWKHWKPTGFRSAECVLQRLNQPVCVVGNGPLKEKTDVNAFATVVRFNNARINGFEDYVGTRTDLWVTNCWHDVPWRPDLGSGVFGAVTTVHPTEDDVDIRKWIESTGAPPIACPQVSWDKLCSETLGCDHPSTGLVFLFMLRELQIPFQSVGFSGMEGGHYWNTGTLDYLDHPNERAALHRLGLPGA